MLFRSQKNTVVSEGFDDVAFDSATTTSTPGSFDYSSGVVVTVNDLFITRAASVNNPDRLFVTLNGDRLFYGKDFTIFEDQIILEYTISVTDIVMITEMTTSIVPNAMAFRIFQDMRGVQAVYRMTTSTTTTLTQDLAADDDIIYVDNAMALDQPDLVNNIWGILTVNGERIMYRNRDTIANTVSSLRRGTAGTAAADHVSGSIVYNMGRGNLLPVPYQNYIDSNYFLADGTTTIFEATNISFDDADSTLEIESVEVWVGAEPGIPGERVTSGYTLIGAAPVKVEFDVAPADGVGVTILVNRGVTWYAPGAGTPSNGVALQDTDTPAARFLRGL